MHQQKRIVYNMKNYKFYKETKQTFEAIAKLKNIPTADFKRYETMSDLDESWPWYNKYTDISLIYCQLLFHAQNGQGIGPTINFIDNFDVIEEVTFNFNPQKVCDEYKDDKDIFDKLVKKGIKANQYTQRYSKTILAGAIWLKGKTKNDVIQDLARYKSPKKLITYFRDECITDGVGVPLAADFLKELDPCFSFLGKPDTHIIDVWAKKSSKKPGYYRNSNKKSLSFLKI